MNRTKKSQLAKASNASPMRYDWYETDEEVVVSVVLKNAVKRNYTVHYEREKLRVIADGGVNKLEIKLFRPIHADRSTHKVFASKLEISLCKATAGRWHNLELQPMSNDASASRPPRMFKTDWENFIKEFEKLELKTKKSKEEIKDFLDNFERRKEQELSEFFNECEGIGVIVHTEYLLLHRKPWIF